MSFSQPARSMATACCLLMAPLVAFGQGDFASDGGEYAIAGALVGDQVRPEVAINTQGGFLVWEDNITDGDGLGISALRLDNSFTGLFSPFMVSASGAKDQQNARVALLKNGGAVFVWQGGAQGFQQIYARFLSASNLWVSGDILVSTSTNSPKLLPAVAVLTNGNALVVWGSYEVLASGGNPQYQDVYGQLLSPTGAKIGTPFQINQVTAYSQRTPAVTALSDGRAVVAWVSEQQRYENSVDIYARFVSSSGAVSGGEFVLNSSSNLCGYPSLAGSPDGGFLAVWSEHAYNPSNRWDIVSRGFTSAGVGGTQRIINAFTFSDQIAPKLAANGDDYMAVWTSYSQDGSWEGAYGRFLAADGSPSGTEVRLNTTVVGPQMQPAVAGDGAARFLTVWTSGETGINSHELKAQRYVNIAEPLPPLDAPFVIAVSSNALMVTWSGLAGYDVAQYQVYADGVATPTVTVADNWWMMAGLAPQSTHSFRVSYQLVDGRKSPLSASASGQTYAYYPPGGLPGEFLVEHWGPYYWLWPPPDDDSDDDGMSNRKEWLTGTDPRDPTSVLRTHLETTSQGNFLHWTTVPGYLYQVQYSPDMVNWTGLGGVRFAAGTEDSTYVHMGQQGFYQVLRVW